jgi:SAM-dependent MidA family methyltransferase
MRLQAVQSQLLSLAGNDNFIPFEAFMHTALYAPHIGYYASTQPVGSRAEGADFTTAPQISVLFGVSIAQSLAPVFASGVPRRILECGAGTGQLAFDVLSALQQAGMPLERYEILEVSASLREQQQKTLANFPQVQWVSALPPAYEGVILGNELLDAMPVQAYEAQHDGTQTHVFERGASWDATQGRWVWARRCASAAQASVVLAALPEEAALQPSYQMELGQQALGWVSSAAACLQRGVLLLVDYGFPCAELYHPQRQTGTLMAHIQHRASTDVLAAPGAADITAHIDFSAVAKAAQTAGLALMGYTCQARFLINAGIAQAYLAAQEGLDTIASAQLSRSLQLLISEAEMGELFKVIALGKDCAAPSGFESGDRRQRL